MPAPRDVSGMRFGRVTIIENVGQAARCQCDCGQEFQARTSAVTTGHTKSCGCYRAAKKHAPRKPVTGRRFGHRRVIEQSESSSLTVCICGYRAWVRTANLRRGTANSCGCYGKVQDNARKSAA